MDNVSIAHVATAILMQKSVCHLGGSMLKGIISISTLQFKCSTTMKKMTDLTEESLHDLKFSFLQFKCSFSFQTTPSAKYR